MAQTFDAPSTAKLIIEQIIELKHIQEHMNTDKLKYAPDDLAQESPVAGKIREELQGLWSDPKKVQSLGLAVRDLVDSKEAEDLKGGKFYAGLKVYLDGSGSMHTISYDGPGVSIHIKKDPHFYPYYVLLRKQKDDATEVNVNAHEFLGFR